MKLADAMQYRQLAAGGPGSGCHGGNCGRPGLGKGKELGQGPMHPMNIFHKTLSDRGFTHVRSTGTDAFGRSSNTQEEHHYEKRQGGETTRAVVRLDKTAGPSFRLLPGDKAVEKGHEPQSGRTKGHMLKYFGDYGIKRAVEDD